MQRSLTTAPKYELSDQQVAYFNLFGFLHLPGVFADDIDDITNTFEQIFADAGAAGELWEIPSKLHGDRQRQTVPSILDKDPWLADLQRDPRIVGPIETLIGPDYEYAESDGNLLWCDTTWHPDTYGSPPTQFHVKAALYLDPLTRDTGALRVLPGSHHFFETYSKELRNQLFPPDEVEGRIGVDGPDVPCHVLESQPGDLLLWNYRIMHSTFLGYDRRRLITVGFREPAAPSDQ